MERKPKIKICGMKHPENIREAAALHPDYMGFIFWERSPRFFTGMLPELPETIKKTGVFVNAPAEKMTFAVQQHRLHALQLHGDESPELCRQLKTYYKEHVEIIKVFSMKDSFNFKAVTPYEEGCDYFLFDTGGKLPGGNGATFDWTVLNDYPSQKPFFLSGGIGPETVENIKELLKTSLPVYAIDVNSRFEKQPGVKNKELLQHFMKSF